MCLKVSETISFRYFYAESVVCGEGDDANKVTVTGFDFEPEPGIVRN